MVSTLSQTKTPGIIRIIGPSSGLKLTGIYGISYFNSIKMNNILYLNFKYKESLASNNQNCNIPFNFNSRSNDFCVKMPDSMNIQKYRCLTNNGYADCDLGRIVIILNCFFLSNVIKLMKGQFYGIHAKASRSTFNINWETVSPISLPVNGNITTKLYIFFNCYGKTSGFFSSDSVSVKDKLKIFKKYLESDSYSLDYESEFKKSNSVNTCKN